MPDPHCACGRRVKWRVGERIHGGLMERLIEGLMEGLRDCGIGELSGERGCEKK